MDRRQFLVSGFAGCSLAASPLVTPVTFASAPWDARLVVIILRGGMDGLDVVQPYGDPALAGLRKRLAFGEAAGASDLDGFFALHPGLSQLMPLWQAGELGFAHAVSTPYRDKRSHFDGQDLLEAGTSALSSDTTDSGWLNRMLASVPGVSAETGYAIGRDEMLLMSGRAPVAEWSPDASLSLSPQAKRLLELTYHDDPLFREAVAEAIGIAESLEIEALAAQDAASPDPNPMQQMAMAANSGDNHVKIAEFAANRLRQETRVAAFSIGGWDSHSNQERSLRRPLTQLQDTILTLKSGLGSDWGKTVVMAMTEFGRTVRENGTAGTDHGTGGAVVMAGGALRGGRVYGDWPGLRSRDLLDGRDLMPTADVRAYAAHAMRGLFGLDQATLEGAVFPGLDMGRDMGILA
ncbi:DUF1501 domain-containing protein [Algirhabdus cladophorae]|uniref:DUF1501 domain-containing protein n=1 Tax=Algirhabdus cladophorae TaxID=3377108 RepID=UPI003B84A583